MVYILAKTKSSIIQQPCHCLLIKVVRYASPAIYCRICEYIAGLLSSAQGAPPPRNHNHTATHINNISSQYPTSLSFSSNNALTFRVFRGFVYTIISENARRFRKLRPHHIMACLTQERCSSSAKM